MNVDGGDGCVMDAEQRQRLQVDYFHRAEKQLLRRAKWLKKFKTSRTGLLHVDHPGFLTESDFAAAEAILKRHGMQARPRSRWRRDRKYADFVIDAPHQPRALQVQTPYHREQLRPLRMTIVIDGGMNRCVLYYAGFIRMSGSRWSLDQQQAFLRTNSFPVEPEADIDFILEEAAAIFDERSMLLRLVCWDEIGMGSGLYPLAGDMLVEAREPLVTPPAYPTLDRAAEAILYSWSGVGDRWIVEPRYEEARRLAGGR